MLRSVSPACLRMKKSFFCSALTGTWPDHSVLQAPKLITVESTLWQRGQLGRTMYSSRNKQKHQVGQLLAQPARLLSLELPVAEFWHVDLSETC